jgi:hypothetical protein
VFVVLHTDASRVNGAPGDRASPQTALLAGEIGHQMPQPQRSQRRRRGTEDEERM